MTVLLFTGNKCAACNEAKRYAKQSRISYTEVNRDTHIGALKAVEYSIMSIPTLLTLDREGKVVKSFHGSTCFENYLKWSAK